MIVLPIGHEKGTVRRLPWVTFSIMAMCVVIFVLTTHTNTDSVDDVMEQATEVVEYFMNHPHLELSEDAQELLFSGMDEHSRAAIIEMYRSSRPRPSSVVDLAEQQAELVRLVSQDMASADHLPYRRWGLVPASPSVVGFVSHMFLHGGWLHLLGNLFILYLAGPFIEDVWGRRLFSGFYLAAGLAAAALFLLRHPDVNAPLIGASGAIAGVMGAFLVRYWSTQIHFFYTFGFLVHGTFSAPAWAMLPIWFVEQLFMAMVTESNMPGGGVAYWAHVGGFAFGIGVAMAMRHYKVEEQYINPAIDAQVNMTLVDNETVDRALEARAAGDTEAAFAQLAAEVKRQPANREAAMAFWQVATEQDQATEAAPAVLRVIKEQLRRGEVQDALNMWLGLIQAVPGIRVDPLLLVRLARCLSESGRRDQAVAALRLALLDPDDALTAAMALRIGREARDVDTDLARGAARLALSRGDLNEVERAGAEALMAEMAGP